VISAAKIFGNRLDVFLIIFFALLCSPSYAKPIIGNEAGNFAFTYKTSDQTKTIPVYYFAPPKLSRASRIVFVIHSDSRSGKQYRDEWAQYAVKYNFLVLCPEFSSAEFDWWKFNAGNIYDMEKKKYNPRQDWTFNIIEQLFDFAKRDRQMKAEAYCIFGHSAGAQFVQRMVLFMPEARFSLAISNGAGGYTLPTFDKKFTDGIRGLITEESLKKSFAKEMIILMGDLDYVSKTMPKSEGAFHQYDRTWRAKIFYDTAKAEAAKRNAALNWHFKFVPNADHQNRLHAEYGSKFAATSKLSLPKPELVGAEPNNITQPKADQTK
jgi:poly(3-hydroxybutyrate) depolymerase